MKKIILALIVWGLYTVVTFGQTLCPALTTTLLTTQQIRNAWNTAYVPNGANNCNTWYSLWNKKTDGIPIIFPTVNSLTIQPTDTFIVKKVGQGLRVMTLSAINNVIGDLNRSCTGNLVESVTGVYTNSCDSIRLTNIGTPGVGKVLTSDALGYGTWQNGAKQGWGFDGDTITDTTFIGTTNNKDFVIKRNSVKQIVVKSDGKIVLGDSINKNIFLGIDCGLNNIVSGDSGTTNTGLGFKALKLQRYGETNTAYGYEALRDNQDGDGNTAMGGKALVLCTGDFNTAIGDHSGESLTTGTSNAYIGFGSGRSNTVGNYNVGHGLNAMGNTTVGSDNTALGGACLRNNVSGNLNTCVGSSNAFNILGSRNTIIGAEAATTNTGSDGVYLGYRAGYYETQDSKLFIDNQKRIDETDGRNKALIYGKFDASTSNQFIVVNGAMYMQDSVAPFHYFQITIASGIFVLTDTGSANAPN